MTRTTLAVAADYADALLVARRSKNLLFLLLLLMLLLQVAVFALYHFHVGETVTVTPAMVASDTPARSHGVELVLEFYPWVVNVTGFLGLALTIVLAVVLLLTAVIMLVGRLIGVSHVTSAFVWCVFLAVILFPWQSLLKDRSLSATAQPDPRLPGVLTTWSEVRSDSRFESKPVTPEVVLHWMRFVGWPIIAIVLLLIIQSKGSTGLRFALGEADIPIEANSGRPNENLV